MPNVLHAIDTGGPGGAEMIFARLANDLRERGYDPAASVPYVGWLHARLKNLGLPTQVIPSKGGFSAGYLRSLLSLVRTQRIELIHSHLLGSNVYCSLVARLTGLPVVNVFHGLPDISGRNSLLWLKRRLLLQRNSAIVAVSENLAEALVRWGMPAGRVNVIVNGVDTSAYTPGASAAMRASLGADDDDVLVGSVGNIRRAKNYPLLIDAAALALQREPRLLFVIAGQGSPEALGALRDAVTARGLAARIKFLGFHPSSPELLRAFDLFVSTSITEGLPLSFLEAMACAVPIVASRNGGSDEVLARGEAGVIVPGDAPALAEAIVALAHNAPERARLAGVGRERVVSVYSWSKTLDAYADLYGRLLKRRKQHATG